MMTHVQLQNQQEHQQLYDRTQIDAIDAQAPQV